MLVYLFAMVIALAMYALRLPFQGALLNCAYRLPKVPLRLPWAMYALRLPFQGVVAIVIRLWLWRAESPMDVHSPGQAERHPGKLMSCHQPIAL